MTSFTHLTKIITTNLDTTFVTCVCTLRSPRATVSYTKCHDNYTLFRFIPCLFLTYVKYFQLFYRVLFGQETGFGNWAMMVTSHAQLVNSDKQNELLFAVLSWFRTLSEVRGHVWAHISMSAETTQPEFWHCSNFYPNPCLISDSVMPQDSVCQTLGLLVSKQCP